MLDTVISRVWALGVCGSSIADSICLCVDGVAEELGWKSHSYHCQGFHQPGRKL